MGDAAPGSPTADAKPATGIALAGLAFAVLAVAVTAVDFLSSIQPLSPTVAGWRYQASASLAGGLAIPMLAIFVAAFSAWYLDRPALTSRLAAASTILAGLLVAIWLVFMIDGFTMRGQAKPEERSIGDAGILQASLKFLLQAAVLFVIGRTLRAPRPDPQGK
jgi:hypothetical protein